MGSPGRRRDEDGHVHAHRHRERPLDVPGGLAGKHAQVLERRRPVWARGAHAGPERPVSSEQETQDAPPRDGHGRVGHPEGHARRAGDQEARHGGGQRGHETGGAREGEDAGSTGAVGGIDADLQATGHAEVSDEGDEEGAQDDGGVGRQPQSLGKHLHPVRPVAGVAIGRPPRSFAPARVVLAGREQPQVRDPLNAPHRARVWVWIWLDLAIIAGPRRLWQLPVREHSRLEDLCDA